MSLTKPPKQPDWTYDDEHLEMAKKVIDTLDVWRRSGYGVPEQQIIAQAICDAQEGVFGYNIVRKQQCKPAK